MTRGMVTILVASALSLGTARAEFPAAPVKTAAGDPMSARAFEVRFKTLADAAELVSPILSPQGTVTLQPRLKTLTVQDRSSVLDRVTSLLRSFDVAPRNVEIAMSLFLGTDRREQEAGRSLPSTAMTTDEYRVAYDIDTVRDQSVKLTNFVLQRITHGPDGKDFVQDVYSAAVVLPVGRMLMLGAAQNPESKRALFLTLQARPR